jgi:hypothetical protein
MTPPINTLPEGTTEVAVERPSDIARILTGTKLTLLAAVVAGGLAGKPQEVQAQETGIQAESAVFTLPVVLEWETLTDEDIAKMQEAISRFNTDLEALTTQERQIAGVDFSQIIEWFDTHQKQRVIGLYMAGMTVDEAVNQVYYSSLERTPDNVREAYGQLINLGRQEYIIMMLQTDRFVSGRFADKDDIWKRDKASEFFDEDLEAYLQWNNTGGEITQRLAAFAPTTTEAFLALEIGTPQILEELSMSLEIARAELDIAEAQADIAEQLAIQAELRALIWVLQANS